MLSVDGETRTPFCHFGKQSGKIMALIMYGYPITLLTKKGKEEPYKNMHVREYIF